MVYSRFFLKTILIALLFAMPQLGISQYTTTSCQTVTSSLIGPDRNDWSHANLLIVNEGYLHNFDPPILPCGINNPSITSLVVNIDIISINSSVDCSGIPLFGNILLNCSLNNTSVCPIIQDVLTPGCNTFGGGSSVTGMYSLDIATCNAINATDVIGVDIIPATDFSALCPSTGTAITFRCKET